MSKPVYMTTYTVRTVKHNSDGSVENWRETSYSFGAQLSNTAKDANKWHMYMCRLIEVIDNIANKRIPS